MLKLSLEPFTSSEKKPDPKKNEKYLKTIKARLEVIWNIYSDFLKKTDGPNFGKN